MQNILKSFLIVAIGIFSFLNCFSQTTICQYEYWYDNDWIGKTTVSVLPVSLLDLNQVISLSNQPSGFHFFNVRFKDNNGLYSCITKQYFYKSLNNPNFTNKIISYSYWFDNDYLNKVNVILPAPADPFNLSATILTNSLPSGIHTFHIHFKDILNSWSVITTDTFSQSNQSSLINGIVSYWKLDETSGNAFDAIGSNTLIANGGASRAAGKINNGANLVRSNHQSFSITDAAQNGLDIAGDISFSGWFKVNSIPANGSGGFSLLSKFNSAVSQVSYNFTYGQFGGALQLTAELSANGYTSSSYATNYNLGTGIFHHIAMTWNAFTSTATIYVDGNNVGSGTTGNITSIFNSTAPFSIGETDVNDPNNYFDGIIDEVGIWSRVLSGAEVTELYNNGSGLQYPFNNLPPSPSVLTIWNSLQNVDLLLINSSVSNNTPVKVCADGSQATYIEYENNDPTINTSNIEFRIAEDTAEINTSVYGFFENSIPSALNSQKAFFNHPTYMDTNGLFRTATIEVIDHGNSNAVITTYPMQIYRAPVLFVHGLWGDLGSFRNMEQSFVGSNLYPMATQSTQASLSPLTLRANYQTSNAASFAENYDVVRSSIDNLFIQTRNDNFSAGQVDLVCHSMGGILARQYLDGIYESYRNDIHKLITLNTPHKGTQVANYLQWPCNGYLRTMLSIKKYYCNQGAIDDLFVGSGPILDLNLEGNQPNKVPSHTITTTGYSIGNIEADFVRTLLIPAINTVGIYYNEANDLIVPISSQQGGIFENVNPVSTNQWHVGSSENENVKDAVKDLLNASPSSSDFTLDGFGERALLLDPPATNCSVSHSLSFTTILGDSITITNPLSNANFYVGDSVQVNVSGTGNVSRTTLYVGNDNIDVAILDTATSSFSFKFKIPDGAYGKLIIAALGSDSNNFIALDTIKINVFTFATLDSIKIIPDSISLPVSKQFAITINGYFSDSSVINLVDLNASNFILDTSIAMINENGFLVGVYPGDTIFSVSYQNKTATAKLHVYADSSLYKTIFGADQNHICRNNSVNFIDYSFGNPTSWNWSFPGGIPTNSTLKNPSINYDSAGTYDVTLVTNWSGKTDTLTLSNYINVSYCPLILNTKLFLQGFYLGNGIMQNVLYKNNFTSDSTVCDTVRIELHQSIYPFNVLYGSNGIIKTNGEGTFSFQQILPNNYYIVIKHRNSLETWTASPINFNSDSINYDFTEIVTNTYGNNLFDFQDGNFGIYTGDVNQDGAINIIDFNILTNSVEQFTNGYSNNDLNGDDIVESSDFSLIENNVNLSLILSRP